MNEGEIIKKRVFQVQWQQQIQNTEHVSTFSINEERKKKILQWNEWMNHESFILHGKIYIILGKNSYCDFCSVKIYSQHNIMCFGS